jgi:hypothetical protein
MVREFDDIEITILLNLYKGGYINKRHTPMRNAIKGISSDKLGEAKKLIKNLIKERYLNPYPTGHDLDVRINPARLEEIKEIPKFKEAIEDHF